MIYRELGQTGLSVSILSYGASPLGNEFGAADPNEGVRAVHYAIERGINYFDVSPYYGRTLAETRLGQALTGYRDMVFVATKMGRYDTGICDLSAERVVTSVEASVKRVRSDYLDVFEIHDMEYVRKEQSTDVSLPAMVVL